MKRYRIGIVGAGFWADYQVAAWREFSERSEIVAIADQDGTRARALAEKHGIPQAYESAEAMLAAHPDLDLIDLIAHPTVNERLADRLAQYHPRAVVCQKPLATSLEAARTLVDKMTEAGVPLYVHENFRWQTPLRRVKELLDAGAIGEAFRYRIYYNSSFPVFENQPFLAREERMIIADLGIHLLDVARFLGGEVERLACLTRRVNPDIAGEDVATIMLRYASGADGIVEMSYASIVDYEAFPQTLLEIHGKRGSLQLRRDFDLSVTTREGTRRETVPIPYYLWAHPQYAVAQTAMVGILGNFLDGLDGTAAVETTGEDNLRTLALVEAAYGAAEGGKWVTVASLQ